MLSKKEKEEMLTDARSARRRESFRKARRTAAGSTDASLDSYLKFLSSVHKVFSRVSVSKVKPPRAAFKL